ncbi:MAG: hypothetical protein PHS59_15975 [Paludibacter sp.]|nr:hypothetical protein [Paludibacter sp.]
MKLIKIRSIVNKIGIDKSIFYTSFARIIQALGGVVAIIFVAKYLTGVEQGFYYTFGSIVAIQVFFELGLNGIITQYVAHEAAHLEWKDNITLTGDTKHLSRLSSLLHFSIKWYSFFAIILFITLIIVGFLFFTKYDTTKEIVSWKIPWLLLAVGTAINLMIAPILAFFEGLGKVKEVAKIRLFQQSLSVIVVCGGLFAGAKLYVSGINWLIGIILVVTLIVGSDFRKILIKIWEVEITDRIDYKKEIFPFQWKIALSWVSGYFIFQLFNPVLFATEGAVVAGQMGMTLAALNGITSLSMSWMSTKVPLYSNLIALKKYFQLDSIFSKTLKQSAFINGFAIIFLFLVVYFIRHFHLVIGGMYLGDRFLNYLPMILMMAPVFLNQFILSWATYLRCHKKEPFLLISIVTGILCCLSTVFLGKYFGVYGITIGYCSITFFTFIWGYWIFLKKRNEWHSDFII